jgi:carboxyl-terminal processing protease
VSLANRFVPSGALVATREREATRVTAADPDRATLRDVPLVVLLDGYSASASEVLAAAVQDHAVAAIVGEPSYGKGTVQTLKRIGRDRAIVKLTTAHYCSPSLRRIEHFDGDGEQSGIAPDLWLPLTSTERAEVHRFLAGYSPPEEAFADLRAWELREHVRLVEMPPPDRQLDAAVRLLTGEELELRGDSLP